MRAAFIPALPPSALLAGMIAPSFRLVNRFCGKSYCARAAAMSGRPRCARYGLGRRSLMSKGPCPLTARCGIGRLCGERRRRERCERLKGARNAPRRTRPRSTSNHPEAPRSATLSRASRPPPTPHLRRPFRAYILGYTPLSPVGSDAPPRASAPAAAGASRPLALRRGQEGSAPLPRQKTSAGADLFRRPYLGTTAFFIPLTLSMAYRTASMVWLSWSGYRGRTRPLRSRSYS